MILNYIKIALRNLSRQRGYSIINILGLAIGLTVCLIIVMYVADEMSYDEYHEKSDRIYRVTRQWFDYDGQPTLHLARIAAPIGPLLENDFALVEESVRFHEEDLLVSYEDRHYVEEDVFYAEHEVF
ncbi:MAG: ABC transporter permease, partial [Candidatus Marinimicrobia bacterium]|nr:ABC transporter permease [Candidatus Neomarinimicrobiota bacterium]